MKPVLWASAAREDLRDIILYISQDNPYAARRVAQAIRKAGQALGQRPTGRVGRMVGTYEKVVQGLPYTLAYATETNALVILRIIHHARDWRPDDWPQ